MHVDPQQRRSFLTGTGLLLAGALCSPVEAAAVARIPVGGPVASVRRSKVLTLTAYNDPNFAVKLAKHFPALVNDRHFSSVAPLAVLVENEGTASVSALSLTWNAHTPTGVHQSTMTYCFTPKLGKSGSPSFGRQKGNRTRFSGKIPLLRPGKVRLITPFCSWSPTFVARQKTIRWEHTLTRKTTNEFFLYQATHATSTHASLEAVVFRDGTVHGEDRHGIGLQFKARRNAERDAAVSALKMKREGFSDGEIASRLAKQGTGFTHDQHGKLLDRHKKSQTLYYAARAQHANVLLDRMGSTTPDRFWRTVHYLAKQRKTQVSAVA